MFTECGCSFFWTGVTLENGGYVMRTENDGLDPTETGKELSFYSATHNLLLGQTFSLFILFCQYFTSLFACPPRCLAHGAKIPPGSIFLEVSEEPSRHGRMDSLSKPNLVDLSFKFYSSIPRVAKTPRYAGISGAHLGATTVPEPVWDEANRVH